MASQETKLLEATTRQLQRPEIGLREQAEAVAGEQVLKALGCKGYASVVRHTAAWVLEAAGDKQTESDSIEDRELVTRMHICALAREVQGRSRWARAIKNPEVAPSAYELARLTAESSRSYLCWVEALRALRAAANAPRNKRSKLTKAERMHLDGLLSDDFNVVLLLYLGRAALHESFQVVTSKPAAV